MSMCNDISFFDKGNKEECLANARVVSVLTKRFGIGQWSFFVPGFGKKWSSLKKNSPQGFWDHIEDKMLLILFSVQRLHCPCVSSKAKDTENCQYILLRLIQRLRLLRMIVSANQLSLYGAVENMCEEFETHQVRSGQLDVLVGQSVVLSENKAEVPLENDIPSHQNLLLRRYEERIKLLSQENKVSKFCMDAGFVRVVEVGQYFMTKDTVDLRQFHTVVCRE